MIAAASRTPRAPSVTRAAVRSSMRTASGDSCSRSSPCPSTIAAASSVASSGAMSSASSRWPRQPGSPALNSASPSSSSDVWPIAGRRGLGERAAQQDGGGVGRAGARGRAGGGAQALDHPVVTGRRRDEQMLGEHLVGRAGVAQQLGGAAVAGSLLGCGYLAVDAGTHDRVDERERPRGLDDAGRRQAVGEHGGVGAAHAREPGGERQVGGLEDRERLREPCRRLREPREPRLDPAPDGAGAEQLDLLGRRDLLLAQRARQRADEQRHAAGRVAARAREGRLVAADHAPHGGRTERRQADDLDRRVADERRDERVVEVRPRAGQDRYRQLLQPRQQEGEEAQGRRVRPVDVVDAQQQRLARRQVRAEPVQPVQDGEQVARAFTGRAGQPECRGGQRRGALDDVGELLRRRESQRGLEQLPYDAEREVALQLRAAGAERAQAVRRLARRAQHLRLADPCRALDDDQRAGAVACRAQPGADPRQLPFAFEEQAFHERKATRAWQEPAGDRRSCRQGRPSVPPAARRGAR